MKRIFITGGHFTPAKAVIDELLTRGGWEIFYLGRKYSMEDDAALALEFKELGSLGTIKYLPFTSGRPQRKFFVNVSQSLRALLKIFVGFYQAVFYIFKYKPDTVLSFGGYIAVPVVTVAWLLGIPVAHHEQVPAFDYPSKFLCSVASRVMVSFPHLLPGVPNGKWIFTGNPLRRETFENHPTPEIQQLKKLKLKTKQPLVYITGGSQGSHAINESVGKVIDKLLGSCLVIWQTGDSQRFHDFEKITEKISKLAVPLKQRALVKKFIPGSEVGAVYALCDLVVGRSGANTVFELAALRKPGILIPIPWVHDQEQEKNAKMLKNLGLAEILTQEKLTGESLVRLIGLTLKNSQKHIPSAGEVEKLLPPDAASKIANIIEAVR